MISDSPPCVSPGYEGHYRGSSCHQVCRDVFDQPLMHRIQKVGPLRSNWLLIQDNAKHVLRTSGMYSSIFYKFLSRERQELSLSFWATNRATVLGPILKW